MSGIVIHPTAVVETKNIGAGTYIGPFCFISSRVVIGKNCNLVGHASIGTPAEFKIKPEDKGGVVFIDDGVEIREFVTINTPSVGNYTFIGGCCFLMTKSHVGHDCILGRDVVLAPGAAIGGHCIVGDFCYVGLNSSTHQRSELGAYSILGANSFFKGKAPMGLTLVGVPARPIKINMINVEKNAPAEMKQFIIDEANKYITSFRNRIEG